MVRPNLRFPSNNPHSAPLRFLHLYFIHSAMSRPPVGYYEAVNTDRCVGCQFAFPRMPPGGGLCFLCQKLQDPSVDQAAIRVHAPSILAPYILINSFAEKVPPVQRMRSVRHDGD